MQYSKPQYSSMESKKKKKKVCFPYLTLIPFSGENINTVTYNLPDIFLYLHISLNTNGTVQFV